MPYPKSVPFFSQEMICKGKFIDYSCIDPEVPLCKCTSAWLSDLLGFMSREYCHATQLLRSLVETSEPGTFYQPPTTHTLMGSLLLWNDDPRNDVEYIAATLNQLFRKLGYSVYYYE